MNTVVKIDPRDINSISFQEASLDIWDKKYRLSSKDGTPIDKTMDDTYKRVARALEPQQRDVVLRRPDAGAQRRLRIGQVRGHEVGRPGSAARAQLRRDVGMVFQSYNLFPHLTVERNITLALTLVKKQSREEARKRAAAGT